MSNLVQLEDNIGYKFKNNDLLDRSLMHTSYTNEIGIEKKGSNQRLEFLGDAVLELTTREFFYHENPEMSEGEMSKSRASVVCEQSLAACARTIDLGSFLMLGKGEEQMGGRTRESILSDAFEALIGAMYLDGGFLNTKNFIHRFVLNDLEEKKLFYDSKTVLQEMVQAKYTEKISYVLIGESGPDHDKMFDVEVHLGKCALGKGKGKTKKAAEQKAAYVAIKELKGSNHSLIAPNHDKRTGM